MADPKVYIEAPTRAPRKGGIIPVANVIQTGRLGSASGVQWTPLPCDFPEDVPELCWGASPDAGDSKTIEDNIPTAESGIPFGAYVGAQCYLGVNNDYDSRARAQLEATEGRVIEDYLNALPPSGTTSGATTIAEALAAADDWADLNYPGQPVIYVNRGQADILAGQRLLFPDGTGGLWTANGTPVVASASFIPGIVRVSGQVYIFESEMTVTQAIDPTHNREMALAERIYAVGFDCLAPHAFTTTA